MSKHRLREDDDTTLLPPTVEELARRERPTRARFGRQPVIIGLITAALLVSGAAAWALVKPSGDPLLEFPMTGPSASGGAGFVDGFGVVTPGPLPTLRSQPPGAPSTSASPSTGSGPSLGAGASGKPMVSLSPSSAAPVEAPGGGGTTAALAVTYRLNPWYGGFTFEVTVQNNGSAPADWRVRVQFPASTDTQKWAVWSTVATMTPDRVWLFTPMYGKLAPGTSVKFGMTGLRTGTGSDFALVSCTVEGGTCVAG